MAPVTRSQARREEGQAPELRLSESADDADIAPAVSRSPASVRRRISSHPVAVSPEREATAGSPSQAGGSAPAPGGSFSAGRSDTSATSSARRALDSVNLDASTARSSARADVNGTAANGVNGHGDWSDGAAEAPKPYVDKSDLVRTAVSVR